MFLDFAHYHHYHMCDRYQSCHMHQLALTIFQVLNQTVAMSDLMPFYLCFKL